MSEMIERVARAMYRQRISDLGIYGDNQEKTDQAVDRCWPFCSAQARAAIEAMREPTPGMVEAGDVMTMSQMGPVKTYQAMITAALGDA
jgi:hypothetical protein